MTRNPREDSKDAPRLVRAWSGFAALLGALAFLFLANAPSAALEPPPAEASYLHEPSWLAPSHDLHFSSALADTAHSREENAESIPEEGPEETYPEALESEFLLATPPRRLTLRPRELPLTDSAGRVTSTRGPPL